MLDNIPHFGSSKIKYNLDEIKQGAHTVVVWIYVVAMQSVLMLFGTRNVLFETNASTIRAARLVTILFFAISLVHVTSPSRPRFDLPLRRGWKSAILPDH